MRRHITGREATHTGAATDIEAIAVRARAIREFLYYAKKFDGVWWATREEIVDWYLQIHQQHIG